MILYPLGFFPNGHSASFVMRKHCFITIAITVRPMDSMGGTIVVWVLLNYG